jgi:hypothetical protein
MVSVEDPGKRGQDRDQRIEVLVFDGPAAGQRSVVLRDLVEHPERVLVEAVAYRLAP